MAEYIGSRISLISKRDIRYVGTLHEISSENSTVALEQVVSFGTEGRRPDDEVPPSDNVYEYIVFRGSDVKDLRIEEPPKENKPPQPPQVPDDPAILGSARRSTPATNAQAPLSQSHAHPQQPQQQPRMQNQQQLPIHNQKQSDPPQQMRGPQQMQTPFGNNMPMYPYYYPPPPNQRFGPQGFPPGPGFPGMPYGAPPGWYPPNQSFPNAPHGQFYPPQMQPGPIGPQQRPGPPQMQQAPLSAQAPQALPTEAQSEKIEKSAITQEIPEKPIATVKLPSTANTPCPPPFVQNGPPPPTESKPDVAAALAPPAPVISQEVLTVSTKPVPTGPKSNRIMPAVPLRSPAVKVAIPVNGTLQSASGNTTTNTHAPVKPVDTRPAQVNIMSTEDATEAARRAVAAAMAKTMGQKKTADGEGTMDNLAKKVSEMRTNDSTRNPRQANSGGYRGRGDSTVHRGRGGPRGGRTNFEHQTRKIDVPTTDYDFESANAKFNKQDLVKEAIATGSPMGTLDHASNGNLSGEGSVNGAHKESEHSVIVPPTPGYNKSSSFFDNISSEIKDREDRMGGREFRVEEHKKNFETFGQGSVDNGLRGGYRGRGRGRGFGRGRGAFRGARGTFRGGPGAVAAT